MRNRGSRDHGLATLTYEAAGARYKVKNRVLTLSAGFLEDGAVKRRSRSHIRTRSVSEISATQPEQQVYVPVAYGLHDLRPKESELSLNRIAASVSLL